LGHLVWSGQSRVVVNDKNKESHEVIIYPYLGSPLGLAYIRGSELKNYIRWTSF
jgi:hypothetical protein